MNNDFYAPLVALWEEENTKNGKYTGENLSEYSFPYIPGEYIPVDRRYSAMMSHRWAITCRDSERHAGGWMSAA